MSRFLIMVRGVRYEAQLFGYPYTSWWSAFWYVVFHYREVRSGYDWS